MTPRATIFQVAARAHVSIATVSRVFDNSPRVAAATRDRVLAAAAALDYAPDAAAKGLAAKRKRLLGLVLPEVGGAYYAELLAGFDAAAADLGYAVTLALGPDRQRIRALEARVDGLAVMNGTGEVPMSELRRISGHLPIVSLAGPAVADHSVVNTACRDNAEFLTVHLHEHGRRRILFVGDPTLAFDARDRFEGYLRGMDRIGVEAEDPIAIPFDLAATESLAVDVASGDVMADALVCVNDEVALGLHLHLRRRGVRPGTDVAVTGWDDVPAAALVEPGLTTVDQPVREVGRVAAARLVAQLDGSDLGGDVVVLPTTVVLRASCGCPDDQPGSYPIRTSLPDATTTPDVVAHRSKESS